MTLKTDRRTLVRGIAWTTPVVVGVAAAPAFATSLRKDPGINGWVQISTTNRETQGTDTYRLRFNSDVNGVGPDGAPYGLYIYDPNRNGNTLLDTYTNASMTLWLRTDDDSTPSTGWSNPGVGWSALSDVGLATKPDGLQYRGYRSTYTESYTLVAAEERVYLRDFDASSTVNSSDATYWIERQITVNGVVQSFQRRNGDRGPIGNGFPSSQRRVAGGDMVASA